MHVILITPKVTLVGGSRPQEGNIMVNGQPVCDDGSEAYRAATARVVCRFISIYNNAVQLTIDYHKFPTNHFVALFAQEIFLSVCIDLLCID